MNKQQLSPFERKCLIFSQLLNVKSAMRQCPDHPDPLGKWEALVSEQKGKKELDDPTYKKIEDAMNAAVDFSEEKLARHNAKVTIFSAATRNPLMTLKQQEVRIAVDNRHDPLIFLGDDVILSLSCHDGKNKIAVFNIQRDEWTSLMVDEKGPCGLLVEVRLHTDELAMTMRLSKDGCTYIDGYTGAFIESFVVRKEKLKVKKNNKKKKKKKEQLSRVYLGCEIFPSTTMENLNIDLIGNVERVKTSSQRPKIPKKIFSP